MIRTCPGCGDFYADDSLLFCPADGTPLADLDPHSESWAEGARVVEEKERTLRMQTRRLKLRRVLMTTMTVLITTLVVCVVVVNTYIYLAPQPDAPAVVAAVTPRPSPKPSETPIPTPTPDSPSGLPFVPAVTPTPTPSPTLTATPTHTHTPPPPPKCTADDRQRLGDSIVATHDAEWHEAIKSEQADIVRANVPAGSPARGVEVGNGKAVLGTVTYAPAVTESCADASVTARYEWQVTWDVFFNGKRKTESKTVPGTKTFKCSKGGAAWRCG